MDQQLLGVLVEVACRRGCFAVEKQPKPPFLDRQVVAEEHQMDHHSQLVEELRSQKVQEVA